MNSVVPSTGWHTDMDGPRLEESARFDGPAVALRMLHAEAGDATLVHGPGGHAVAPDELVCAAENHWPRADRATTGTRVPDSLLSHLGLTALSGLGSFGENSEDVGEPGGYLAWVRQMAWLRLGLSRGLSDSALRYLGGRSVGGEPLLRRQLVQGALADAEVGHLRVGTLLSEAGPLVLGWPALRDLHDEMTLIDRGLLRLHGASGFVHDGPGAVAHVSELCADVYAGRSGA